MSERFPDLVDPIHLAVTGRRVSGELQPAQMPRLLAMLYSDKGSINVDMEFGIDGQGIRYVAGHLAADMELVCQRCLESVGFVVNTDFKLGMVTSDTQIEKLPGGYEPLLVKNVPMALTDIIEDELILSIPIVATHAEDECDVAVQKVLKGSQETGSAKARKSPFAVLEELKVKTKD